MNVFGGSQIGEKIVILRLEQSFKFNSFKLVNLKNLLSENIKILQLDEEQISLHSLSIKIKDISSELNKFMNLVSENIKTVQAHEKHMKTLYAVWEVIKFTVIELSALEKLLSENTNVKEHEKIKTLEGIHKY